MKDKKCTTCKKKNTPITSLSTEVPLEDIKKAYYYLQIVTQLTEDKWDFIEDVYNQLYPSKQKLNRGCKECLRNVARGISYEYHKRKEQ